MLNINCKYIYLLLTGAGLKDLPSEILVQIFQYLTIQDCLRGVGCVCPRFQGLIEYTGEVWRTLETDVELRTVPTIVTAHTFCASRDTRVSYGSCLLIQEYFCAV